VEGDLVFWRCGSGSEMKPKVYVETSVLSYLVARPSRDAVTAGRQVITRRWWKTERDKYSLLISEAVEAECERGDPEAVELRRELLGEVSLFPVDERILELARLLVVPGAIPEKAGLDAVHIAVAAVAECDFLLTWNFRHIANVRIRRNVERILEGHGYTKTTICTPDELV
jgi:PIN domain